MILIDTSAWIEFLRNTRSTACKRVEETLFHECAVCDVVRMEVLAGARDEFHLSRLRRLLARGEYIPTLPSDYEDAARLFRQCRLQGETVRKLIDCLIGAVAIRSGVSVLHQDVDFDVLARHSTLQAE